jgi:hypothetical protein
MVCSTLAACPASRAWGLCTVWAISQATRTEVFLKMVRVLDGKRRNLR